MYDEPTPQDTTPADNPQPVPQKPKNRKKAWLTGGLIVVLLAGLAGAGFFAYQKNDRANQLAQDVSRWEGIVAERDAQIAQLQGVDGEGAVNACNAGAAYTAEVGKFTATLDNPYAIVRNLDAGFEGGPATSLSIVTCLNNQSNVFDNQPQNGVFVLANPSASAAELRTAYESNLGAPLTADGDVTVDGVTANKYKADGLFNATVLFFERSGIGYQIELADTNDTTNAILTDLTADWSFTP